MSEPAGAAWSLAKALTRVPSWKRAVSKSSTWPSVPAVACMVSNLRVKNPSQVLGAHGAGVPCEANQLPSAIKDSWLPTIQGTARYMSTQLLCASPAIQAIRSSSALPLQVAHHDAIIRRKSHVLDAGVLAVPAAYDILDHCSSPDKVYIPASWCLSSCTKK